MRDVPRRGAGLRSRGSLQARLKRQWRVMESSCREEIRSDQGFRKITSVNNNDN